MLNQRRMVIANWVARKIAGAKSSAFLAIHEGKDKLTFASSAHARHSHGPALWDGTLTLLETMEKAMRPEDVERAKQLHEAKLFSEESAREETAGN